MADNRKIGVFDSGLGGLTAVREIKKYLPHESIVYFGDTARLPYGSKSKQRIVEFSKQNMRFLLTHDVKAVIIACGTASSNAVDEVRAEFDLPIFGVVRAGAREAVKQSRTGRIGVAATAATIRSGAFKRLIGQMDDKAEVFSVACPLFVPLVESGWWQDDITRQVVKRYMDPLKQKGVDTVIMGCTHYPMLRPLIQEEMGPDVKLINVSKAAVLETGDFLDRHQMQAEESSRPSYEFYTSDSIDDFKEFCSQVLEEDSSRIHAEKIDIEKY
ncbi:MAG TPA: glutamate racemase [Lachnospiraceae bacterium]|nr:glutamate racemase [Lachnospiraceae bacterium]